MNPTTLRLQITAAPTPAFQAVGARRPGGAAGTIGAREAYPSPTLELARACSSVAAQAERTETLSLLAIGSGVAVVLAGAAADLGQGLANWPAFEHFVRSVLA